MGAPGWLDIVRQFAAREDDKASSYFDLVGADDTVQGQIAISSRPSLAHIAFDLFTFENGSNCIYNRRRMIPLILTTEIRRKLEDRHQVQELEVRECFLNDHGPYLVDDREGHRTDPPTLWFLGETHRGRILKIIFVHRGGNIYLKSAYDANDNSKRIYKRVTKAGE